MKNRVNFQNIRYTKDEEKESIENYCQWNRLRLAKFQRWAKSTSEAENVYNWKLCRDTFLSSSRMAQSRLVLQRSQSYFLYSKLDNRFIKIKHNLRRIIHKTNQGCKFLESSFINMNNVRTSIWHNI